MRRGPFWLKLLGAFLAVIVVAVGAMAILVNCSVSSALGSYLNRGHAMRIQALAPIFEDYYQRVGSWQGAERLVHSLSLLPTPDGYGAQGISRGVIAVRGLSADSEQARPSPERVVLAEPDGQVVADSSDALVGRWFSREDLRRGIPLNVNGQVRGYLLVDPLQDGRYTPEGELLSNLNRALLLATLLASGTALLLALLLSRGLTSPLRALATAAADRAAGKHGLSVPTTSGDEIGALTSSFNAMAKALEQREALRRQLIADIAHELCTPLAVIRGNLEALLYGIYRPTPETIAPIHEEAVFLTRLVDDLRDLAIAEAGQLPLHVSQVNLLELVRGVFLGFAAQADERGIELELVLPASDLPAVEVDADRIRQVLNNLLNNALRYTPQRGHVQVALQPSTANWVEVRISDNGPGISPEDLPHVFERFYRGDRVQTREDSSVGLGLAIAKQWVEAHGGRIWAESAPGQGATFSFTLPASKSRPQNAGGTPEP